MDTMEKVLAGSVIFQGVSPAQTVAMLQCMHAREARYAKGAYVLHSGDVVQEMGLVLEGALLLVQDDFWGNRNLLARVEAGEIFAEAISCLREERMNVSVEADTDTVVLWLHMEEILRETGNPCPYHTLILRNLVVALAQKNFLLNRKVTCMSKRTTREKLLAYFSAQANAAGHSSFTIPFNRQQLADYLAVERSAMSVELNRLRREGVLSFTKNHFILLDTPDGT